VKRVLRTSLDGEGLQAQADGKTKKKGVAEALGEASTKEKFLPILVDPKATVNTLRAAGSHRVGLRGVGSFSSATALVSKTRNRSSWTYLSRCSRAMSLR
jgi:hypothetical protein